MPGGGGDLSDLTMAPCDSSIANATCDAVGVRITELPITPERILKALKAKRGE